MCKVTTLVTKASAQPQLAQSPKGAPHTLSHTTPSCPFPQAGPGGIRTRSFLVLHSQSNHHKRDFYIITSKTSYSSISKTSLCTNLWLQIPCTCSPHTPHIDLQCLSFGIQVNVWGGVFCGNSQCLKAVGCFHGGAPSWMFGRNLNATLPNNLF